MLELIIDPRGEVAIDNLEYLMEQFPGYAQRAVASALKSEGFRLSQIIKMVIAGRGVDGSWPLLNPHTGILKRRFDQQGKERWLKNWRSVWVGKKGDKQRMQSYRYLRGERKNQRRVILSTLTEPQSRIRNAVGYAYDEQTNSVDVSFNGQLFSSGKRARMRFLLHQQSEGYSKTITPKMRKMLFAMGFPIKKETLELKVPQRESIQPVFDHQKETIVKNIDEKFQAALNRYIFGGMKI